MGHSNRTAVDTVSTQLCALEGMEEAKMEQSNERNAQDGRCVRTQCQLVCQLSANHLRMRRPPRERLNPVAHHTQGQHNQHRGEGHHARQ